jgi:hypothetical protein
MTAETSEVTFLSVPGSESLNGSAAKASSMRSPMQEDNDGGEKDRNLVTALAQGMDLLWRSKYSRQPEPNGEDETTQSDRVPPYRYARVTRLSQEARALRLTPIKGLAHGMSE